MTVLVAIAVGAVLAALWLSVVRWSFATQPAPGIRDPGSGIPEERTASLNTGSRAPGPGSPLPHPSPASCCQPGGCGCGRRPFEEDC